MIKLFQKLFKHHIYVIADPRDNSITFSKKLCEIMDLKNLREAKIFCFKVEDEEELHYAFTVNPQLEQETQLADVMYNSKHRCVGFESLVPTVGRIFYDYGIARYDKPCKLSVTEKQTQSCMKYYVINHPSGKE